MAVRPGEELVATSFGDVHYFYGSPTDVPPHHRFDKGSYVYLFEDASQGRARIEVANRPGTEHQDAFDGYLDHAHVRYSYKQSCLVTLTVGKVQGHDQWHLPTYDPNNQNIYHYKLHSVDVYFWTPKDALMFVNGVRRLLSPHLVDILDEPGPPPRQDAGMSAVVQKLEKAAISDQSKQAASGLPSFAPPPIAAEDEAPAKQPAAFVPMAYNPAAPAAPEQIRHREKTPPPDDGDVNPLHARLAQDAGTPFSPGLVSGMPHDARGPLSPGMPPPQFLNASGAPAFPGPPIASPGVPPQGFGSLGGVAQHPGITRAATVPVQNMPSYQQPYQQQAAAAPSMPPPPPGGYSQYQYGQSGAAPAANDYSIHQQVYRPTQGEASHAYQPKKEVRGKMEENAGRLERGMTGMLKKFEKKFG